MMKKYVTAGAFVVFCAGAIASAQSTATQQPPSQQPATAQAASTTIEGCVYNEKDIPGRSPNVAERAGVLEDYILVASSSTPSATGTSGTTGAAGMSTPKMFKLEHADDDKLKALVGKRVQVTGKVDAEAGDKKPATGAPQTDRSMGPDRIELPEFEVTSIAETTGQCPATPAIKK